MSLILEHVSKGLGSDLRTLRTYQNESQIGANFVCSVNVVLNIESCESKAKTSSTEMSLHEVSQPVFFCSTSSFTSQCLRWRTPNYSGVEFLPVTFFYGPYERAQAVTCCCWYEKSDAVMRSACNQGCLFSLTQKMSLSSWCGWQSEVTICNLMNNTVIWQRSVGLKTQANVFKWCQPGFRSCCCFKKKSRWALLSPKMRECFCRSLDWTWT